jgi:chromosome segregation protein
MHLKKLIVSGFKSFADKVTLTFDEGITGIVGPNGSGKSNVIDAVRWVMGEQNAKHLRGQVATDIIFAGSDKRKALGMAEVTLVFDNKDHSTFCPPEYRSEEEISLTRRLYVDGQREYLINRKPCRLKDIIEFFTLTGLGGRSYSMIQQGQVDRILNAKPEDVREILEEAAGTLIFRNRRNAAQKKLASTEENLSRIDDIVHELSKQLESLKEQVEKARSWQSLTQKLKENEVSLFAHNYHHFTTQLKELSSQSDNLVDEETRLMADIASLEANVSKLQLDLADADPELEFLREDISKLREQIARAESSLTSALGNIEQGESRLIEVEESFKADNDDLESLRNAVEASRQEYEKSASEVEHYRQLIESHDEQFEEIDEMARVFESRFDELENEIRNIDRLLESNAVRCESIEKERQRINRQREEIQAKIEHYRDELGGHESHVEKAKQKADAAQTTLDDKVTKRQDLESSLKLVDDELKKALLEKDELKEAYLSHRARLTSLEEIQQQANNLTTSLADLQSLRPDVDTLHKGLLTDYVSFDETQIASLPDYLKKSFEHWSERLICESFADFSKLSKLFDEYEPCSIPASILASLSAEQVKSIATWTSLYGGALLQGSLKIARDAPKGIELFLQTIVVIEHKNLSEKALLELPQGIVLFTDNGLICNDAVSLLLSRNTASGVLSRKSELERLAKQIIDDQASLNEKTELVDQLEAKRLDLRAEISEMEKSLTGENRQTLAILGELQSARQTYNHTKEKLEEAKSELDRCNERDQQMIRETAELGEVRISLAGERDIATGELESMRDEHDSIDEQKEESQRVRHRHQLDMARSEAKAKALQDALVQSESQLMRLDANRTRRDDEKKRLQESIEQGRLQEAQARQEMETYLMRREELEEELSVRREKSSGILDELRGVENQLKETRSQLSDLQKNRSSKSVDIERLKAASMGVLEQAEEKYQLDLTTYDFEMDESFSSEVVTKEVQSLRRKVDGLGAINMVAIEEYERLSERYEFIQAQKEEVTGSILLLEEAISEIEETSKEKFKSTFEVINENFQSLFPILFPGGEARLELTDPDNILEGGVEIMVRMPGKTRRSMTLYSGGEKALTAISLIFALLKTKPTPFCFLDEVDAPLDEANVGRYNKVLDALSDRFQFIVITHNRRTMEVLDQLYGVTMQEGGVSTVVGVDMRKDLPDHLRKAFKTDQTKAAESKRPVAGASAKAEL